MGEKMTSQQERGCIVERHSLESRLLVDSSRCVHFDTWIIWMWNMEIWLSNTLLELDCMIVGYHWTWTQLYNSCIEPGLNYTIHTPTSREVQWRTVRSSRPNTISSHKWGLVREHGGSIGKGMWISLSAVVQNVRVITAVTPPNKGF